MGGSHRLKTNLSSITTPLFGSSSPRSLKLRTQRNPERIHCLDLSSARISRLSRLSTLSIPNQQNPSR